MQKGTKMKLTINDFEAIEVIDGMNIDDDLAIRAVTLYELYRKTHLVNDSLQKVRDFIGNFKRLAREGY